MATIRFVIVLVIAMAMLESLTVVFPFFKKHFFEYIAYTLTVGFKFLIQNSVIVIVLIIIYRMMLSIKL